MLGLWISVEGLGIEIQASERAPQRLDEAAGVGFGGQRFKEFRDF